MNPVDLILIGFVLGVGFASMIVITLEKPQ